MQLHFSGNSEKQDLCEREKCHQIILGLIYSAITFLLCILMQSSDADRVGNFLDLFQIFIKSYNGKLIEKTVTTFARIGNINGAKKVVDFIGQFIINLKKVRHDAVNFHVCKKFKPKKFKSRNDLRHHHDLFGSAFTTSTLGSNFSQNCCVSSLFLVSSRQFFPFIFI